MKKTTAYGVQVKVKPRTLMTIPRRRKKRLDDRQRTEITFQNSTFHFDPFVAQFGLHSVFDLVLHAFQPDVDRGVRDDQNDQRNAIDHHEDEHVERDE